MANTFNNLIQVRQNLASWTDQGRYKMSREPLYSPVRLDKAAAATLPAVGDTIYLFDQDTINKYLWGTGVGGAIQQNVDVPQWFILKNRVFPKDRWFEAEFMSIDWSLQRSVASTAGASTINPEFIVNKAMLLNHPTWLEIAPNDTPVQWYIPFREIPDRWVDTPRVTDYSAGVYTVSSYSRSGYGKYPMYPLFSQDMNGNQTPGLIFSPDDVISFKWNIVQALPAALSSETVFRFTLDGWFWRP